MDNRFKPVVNAIVENKRQGGRRMGNRLAEMQLRVLWEEISKRFHKVEVVGQPERVVSNFVRGYSQLPVILHALA